MLIKDLSQYYNRLQSKLNSQKQDFELNGDRAHNTTIMRFMLNNSKVIDMYCGEMSVFRDNFYQYINEEHRQNEVQEELLGDYSKRELVDSLRKFVEKEDTRLNIYLEKFNEDYFKDLIDFQLFCEGISSGKINIYKMEDQLLLKSGLLHVACTDTKIVRMERDKYTHEAICAINVSQDIHEKWNDVFQSMHSVANPVCL